MQSKIIQTSLLGVVLLLSACGEDKPEATPQEQITQAEAPPMSAEPAEPTGVMNVEPMAEPQPDGVPNAEEVVAVKEAPADASQPQPEQAQPAPAQ